MGRIEFGRGVLGGRRRVVPGEIRRCRDAWGGALTYRVEFDGHGFALRYRNHGRGPPLPAPADGRVVDAFPEHLHGEAGGVKKRFRRAASGHLGVGRVLAFAVGALFAKGGLSWDALATKLDAGNGSSRRRRTRGSRRCPSIDIHGKRPSAKRAGVFLERRDARFQEDAGVGREHGTDLETRALGNEALQGAGICARQGKVRDTRQRGKGEPRARERGRTRVVSNRPSTRGSLIWGTRGEGSRARLDARFAKRQKRGAWERIGNGRTRAQRVRRLAHEREVGICDEDGVLGGCNRSAGDSVRARCVWGAFFSRGRGGRKKARARTFGKLPHDCVRGCVATELRETAVADVVHDLRHLVRGEGRGEGRKLNTGERAERTAS